ncbi:nitrate ABC transporter permease [Pseudoclavibacter endophyticus]|uniref:ABC transporter permease n=1 Tax=Pseudoclavibacter endophyticus TaxID=1778590 RepID=A0A6H9WB25_9MICO|nr:ABC transporter permease [Pseudoclavibacter endophyticus]KAB1647803.1 ABC transporter permease [Pseudoclavibacter endophyticus]GGA72948.1 nitrate ABC transporter permease [Pseudoclavibacter endophyticus]
MTAPPASAQAPAPTQPTQRRTGLSERTKSILFGAIGVVVLFLVAEIVSRSGIVSEFFLPPTSVVLGTTLSLLVDPQFLFAVLSTLQAWAIGLAICTIASVALGLLLGSSDIAYTGSRTLIEFLRPIPSVALIPVAMVMLGNGLEMKVGLIIYSAAWPILFNTIYGMHDVDPVAKLTSQSFGRGRLSTMLNVSLPSALPFIFTGIRVSASVALIVAVSAEFFGGASEGLGRWLLEASSTGNRPDLVYAGTIISGLLGLAINALLALIERRFLAWQPALRQTGN